MAARYSTFTGTSATAALTNIATGTALKTILQLLTGSADQASLIEFGISFDGVSSTAVPVEVRLQRQTSAGTGGSTGVVTKNNPNSGAAAATVLVGPAGTWTGEPTAGDILAVWKVSPTSGLVIQYPLSREPLLDVSTRLSIVTISAATVNAWAYMIWEE